MIDSLVDIRARLAITDGIYRYCRGIDRMDKEVLMSVFHPDARVEYPSFSGNRADLVERMWDTHGRLDMHSHQVTNVIVELDADARAAAVEAYVTATWWRRDPSADGQGGDATGGPGTFRMIQGRYLDRWSNPGGQWAIDRRRCVVDIRTEFSVTGAVGDGRRDSHDASYGILGTRSR